jgi:hypothetical protein
MKKSLLFVLSLITWLGYGQTITINSSHSTVLSCDTFQVTFTVSGVSAGDTVRINLTNNPHTTFLSVNGFSHTTNNNIVTWQTIATGSSVTFTYTNKINCNSLDLVNDAITLNLSDVLQAFKINSSSTSSVTQNIPYTLHQPKYQLGSYIPISGDVFNPITRNIPITNGGSVYNGFFEIIETIPNNLEITTINVTASQGNIQTISTQKIGNQYRTLLKGNSLGSFNYIPSYKILCGYTSQQSNLSVKMGCDTLNFCKTIGSIPSSISFLPQNAVISNVSNVVDLTPNCGIEKEFKYTYKYFHTGSVNTPATNLQLFFFRRENAYTLGVIDSASVNFTLKSERGSIIRQYINTQNTNFCGKSASTYINGQGYNNDTLGTFIRIDSLFPSDTLIVEYIVKRCCITNAISGHTFANINQVLSTSRFSSHGIQTALGYLAHPCNTDYHSSYKEYPYSDGIGISQFTNCKPTDVHGNLSDSFSMQIKNQLYFDNMFPASDTNFRVKIRVESQKGIYATDTIYLTDANGNIWSASEITRTSLDTTAPNSVHHEVWASFEKRNLPNGIIYQKFLEAGSKIIVPFISYCPARESESSYTVTTYLEEKDCACLMPIFQRSCEVSVHCPGCKIPGTIIEDVTITRQTLGWADDDDNQRPDDYGQPALPENVMLDRVTLGDTFKIVTRIKITDDGTIADLAGLFNANIVLNKAFLISKIEGGSKFKFLKSDITYVHGIHIQTKTIYHASTNSSQHAIVMFRNRADSIVTNSAKDSHAKHGIKLRFKS